MTYCVKISHLVLKLKGGHKDNIIITYVLYKTYATCNHCNILTVNLEDPFHNEVRSVKIML